MTRHHAGLLPVPVAMSAIGKIHSSCELKNSIIDVVTYGVSVFQATKKTWLVPKQSLVVISGY